MKEKFIDFRHKGKKEKFSSQNFWRENMMKLLEVLYFEEATWARDFWDKYGINSYSAKIIEKEFEKYLKKK